MGLSVLPMSVSQLGIWLEANATEFAAIEEAIAQYQLAEVGSTVLGATGFEVVGGAGTALADAGVTAGQIIDFAAAQQLTASGVEVGTSAIGAVQTASGGAKMVGVLGVELGTVAAAVAPLLGVGLGINLYESNPDFWTKLSQKLLPFCWPDTTKIPSWAEVVNAAWVTSIPKKVYDAIKELFDESIVETTVISSNEGLEIPYEIPFNIYNKATIANGDVTDTWEAIENPFFVGYFEGFLYIIAGTLNGPSAGIIRFNRRYSSGSEETNVLRPESAGGAQTPFVYKGVTSYRYEYRYDKVISCSVEPVQQSGTGSLVREKIGWILANGNTGVGYSYPEGTSKWTGNVPPEILPVKPAYINPTTTEETIPVAFPPEIVPSPGYKPGVQPQPEEIPNSPSADPEEFPDPDKVTDPEVQVSPHIMPTPVPWETIVPDTDPETDPNLDPSKPKPPTQVVDPIPLPDSVTPFPDGIVPFPDMPDTPLSFAQDVGLVTVYHPTAAQLYAFEQWLWVTYQDADIQKIWNNPFDGVISLFELYCTPTDVGNRNIHSGFLDSGVNSAVISRYTEINCGTMGVPEYYGNYLDYSPYTRAYIYLPFIGVQELNADDIVGHAVNVTYRIDEYNGSCIAMITVAKTTNVNGEQKDYSNIMYQFSGNCSVELPITGGSQASIKAGFVMANAYQAAANVSALGQAIGGLASMISTNPFGALGGAVSGIVSTYANAGLQSTSSMLSGKSVVTHSGSFGSSHGALGVKKPFITIVRPKQIRIPNYNKLYGYPAHKQVIVGECTGFLRCLEVHVISATATDEEKSIIESMMKSGVYVTE